jgi:hypothetical protein
VAAFFRLSKKSPRFGTGISWPVEVICFFAMRQCLFCDNTKLTKEHLWPDWIVELFKRNNHRGFTAAFTQPDGAVESWKQPTITNKKRLLCATCNNVTLGSVEHHVKPILQPMIETTASTSLGVYERLALTTWTLTRSMIWDGMRPQNAASYFTQAERVAFATNETLTLPSNLFVWLATYSGAAGRAAFNVNNYLVAEDNAVHITTAVINQVILQLVVWKGDRWSINQTALRSKWGRATHPIWPITSRTGLRWPLAEYLDRKGLHALSQRFRIGERNMDGLR